VDALRAGVDVCYRKVNRRLFEKLFERGAILTEFPLTTRPAAVNSLLHNQLVAGMPLRVLVGESA
jgi:DNA processing protein